jgi:hypothetical protein
LVLPLCFLFWRAPFGALFWPKQNSPAGTSILPLPLACFRNFAMPFTDMTPTIQHAAQNAVWLAHRYDPEHDAFHLLEVPRAVHRASTFLTAEYLPVDLTSIVVRRSDAIAAAPLPAPLHFIFHSAFCCSTLLVRALDRDGVAMGLKEPVVLNDLVGWRRRGATAAQLEPVLRDALHLLARPFGPREAIIVKPSNIVNSFAPAILAMCRESCAVLLHAPLRLFLQSVAKKEMWGRLWVRELLIGQLKDGLVDLGFEGDQYLGLTDLQVAAVTWLAQQALFTRLITHFGSRVRTLDSEILLARPRDALAVLTKLYQLSMRPEEIAEIAAGSAFTQHSKFGTAFSSSARAAEYHNAAKLHGDEIEKVVMWAEAVAKNAGVSMTLSAPLLN